MTITTNPTDRVAVEAVRSLPCTICWAGADGALDEACGIIPVGDHFARWTEARRLGLITAEQIGAALDTLIVVTSRALALTSYCPVPGPVPTSPANNDYKPGFAAALMVKDLTLAQDAAKATGAATPLGKHAQEIYQAFDADPGEGKVALPNLRMMLDVCVAADVETRTVDRRILGWLAGFEPETCAVIAGLVTRAPAAGAEPMRSGSDEDRAESARIPGTPAPLPPGWQLRACLKLTCTSSDVGVMLLVWPLSWRSTSGRWRRSSERSCRIWMSGSAGC